MNGPVQVELERVRLLCERIIKREKVKVRHFHGYCFVGLSSSWLHMG